MPNQAFLACWPLTPVRLHSSTGCLPRTSWCTILLPRGIFFNGMNSAQRNDQPALEGTNSLFHRPWKDIFPNTSPKPHLPLPTHVTRPAGTWSPTGRAGW